MSFFFVDGKIKRATFNNITSFRRFLNLKPVVQGYGFEFSSGKFVIHYVM